MKTLNKAVGATFVALSFTMAGGAFAASTAADLIPGGFADNPSNVPGGLLIDQLSLNGATVVAPWMSDTFLGVKNTIKLSGTLYSTVLTGDSNNPFGVHGLDWVYQIVMNPAPLDTTFTHFMTTSGWDNLQTTYVGAQGPSKTAVGFLRVPTIGPVLGTTTLPAVLDTPANPNGPGLPAVNANGGRAPIKASEAGDGSLISFEWSTTPGSQLSAGFRSAFLIVYTGASAIGVDTELLQDGTQATARAYQPSPVPEPETYAMMLAGLGLMGFVARRRKQTA